jgi:hypothetical protein
MPEMGVEGLAEVLSVQPCPTPAPGNGPLVTGVFRHQVDAILDIEIDGREKIGTTPNHLWWSEDRQEFVPAELLQEGEQVETRLEGKCRITRITLRDGPQTVYNLEVWGEHVYRVGQLGTLVHNAYADLALGRRAAGLDKFAKQFNAAHMGNWVERKLVTTLENTGRRAGFEELFPRIVNETLERGGKLRFNLTKVNVRQALASKSASAMDDYTAWELRQIVANKEWLKNTVFYLNGRRLAKNELKRMGIY